MRLSLLFEIFSWDNRHLGGSQGTAEHLLILLSERMTNESVCNQYLEFRKEMWWWTVVEASPMSRELLRNSFIMPLTLCFVFGTHVLHFGSTKLAGITSSWFMCSRRLYLTNSFQVSLLLYSCTAGSFKIVNNL